MEFGINIMGIKKNRKSARFEKEANAYDDLFSANDESKLSVTGGVEKNSVSPLSIEPYLLRDCNENGSDTLTAIFPGASVKGRPLRINLSFLLDLDFLSEALSESYLKSQGNAPRRSTATSEATRLRTGFVAFLIETGRTKITLSHIDVPMMNAYLVWLDRVNNDGNATLAVETKSKSYYILKDLIRVLRQSKKWRADISSDLDLPSPPWAGKTRRRNPTEIINSEDMTIIRLKCMELVKHTVNRFYETKKIVENFGPLPQVIKRGNEWTLDRFLTEVDKHCEGGPILATPQLPGYLANAAKNNGWGNVRNDIGPRFHAVTSQLVPFIILMTIATAYNPDTIRGALLNDFRFDNTFGEWFVIEAFKDRAGAEQPIYVPVDDEPDNPAFLYKFLVEYTARIRSFVRPDVRNKIFIGSSRMNMSEVIDIDTGLWNALLNQFIKEHKLPKFTLQSIRPTVLDVTGEVFSDDLKAMQLQANHKNAQTTYTHYTSDAKRQRDYERLGAIQQMKQRWRESKGKIENRDRSAEEDLSCATPGWTCADPFDSPFSPKGKMCGSYGHCPRCPLGSIDLNSPLAFALAIALRDAINRAQHAMAAETWLMKMGAVKLALERKWLPSFTSDAVRAAKTLYVPQLPIPE
ncbi:hypothetical protein NX786_01110 [Telluria mixta]|uniref:Uncharacterized protein n=1 Tax=Telluria mixta TaxID=34071 RepID=A0ABT2BS48_9BURK|nr:hypothetical protein [Telluria mixta]MCS0627942.1 hypothetical protein [Telluria mixta]WEM93939.1 hypothetical protein P0M04_20880 [Telluria mixta]